MYQRCCFYHYIFRFDITINAASNVTVNFLFYLFVHWIRIKHLWKWLYISIENKKIIYKFPNVNYSLHKKNKNVNASHSAFLQFYVYWRKASENETWKNQIISIIPWMPTGLVWVSLQSILFFYLSKTQTIKNE